MALVEDGHGGGLAVGQPASVGVAASVEQFVSVLAADRRPD